MGGRTEAEGGHRDSLALDAVRAGEGTPADRDHVASCSTCRAALVELGSLERALKAAEPRIPEVPRAVELRILRGYRDARARMAPAPLPVLLRRWAVPAIGAAAAAALLLTLNPVRLDDPGKVPAQPARTAVNPIRNGARTTLSPPPPLKGSGGGTRADILDAFRLARALRDRQHVEVGWDADANGLVDAADVEVLARQAVTL